MTALGLIFFDRENGASLHCHQEFRLAPGPKFSSLFRSFALTEEFALLDYGEWVDSCPPLAG